MPGKQGDGKEFEVLDKPRKLGEPYKTLDWTKLDQRSKGSISEVYLVKNEKSGETFIRLCNRHINITTNEDSFGNGFNIYDEEIIPKIVAFTSNAQNILGWETDIFTEGDLESQSEVLTEEIGKRETTIAILHQQLREQETVRRKLIQQADEKHKKEIEDLKKDTGTINRLEKELKEFTNLIANFDKNKSTEEDIQKFLDGKKWFFGTSLISAKSKARAGSTDIFDFLLTYTDGSQRIAELKRPSVEIIDKSGQISGEVTKGLDQLIGYLEQTTAIAHASLPESRYITEKRPKGMLIIGYAKNDIELEKLKSWNYALHLVEIKTYAQLIKDAETILGQLKGISEEGKDKDIGKNVAK